MMQAEFILYVQDQQRSRDLYRVLLDREPVLDVPGMTEFDLGGCKLGLMPASGIARIMATAVPRSDSVASQLGVITGGTSTSGLRMPTRPRLSGRSM